MASLKTDLIQNLDSGPPVLNDVGKSSGTVRVQTTSFVWNGTTLDDIGDFMRLCRMPTNARIISMVFFNYELDGHGTPTIIFDIGVYPINSDIAVSADCINANCGHFKDGRADAAAELYIDWLPDVSNMGKTLWELAGLGSDPGGLYDICMTIGTAAATDVASADVSFRILYTID